jgi:hypothetical protein
MAHASQSGGWRARRCCCRFHPAILEEHAQTWPARERVADCLGEFGLLADQRQLFAQPGLEGFDQCAGALLTNGQALLGRTAADVILDPIEPASFRRGNQSDDAAIPW